MLSSLAPRGRAAGSDAALESAATSFTPQDATETDRHLKQRAVSMPLPVPFSFSYSTTFTEN